MKLSHEQIRAICQGAVRTKETEKGVRLYRFTEAQEELYRQVKADFHRKSFASAGMKLCFKTDSTSLFLKVNVTPASTRQYFSIDVWANGIPAGYLDNYSHMELPQNYASVQCPLGEFSKKFELGEGDKLVKIYLPWSVAAEIMELSLDDHAWLTPDRPEKRLLAFGDSITQGYDALRPSSRYIARLAEALGAEEVNKAIGGEWFRPELVRAREAFEPDYITVAYGTCDWSRLGEEEFKDNCRRFYEALCRDYPSAEIIAITPIWRKDYKEDTKFGPFFKVAEDIEAITKEYENITCCHGFDFVPPEEKYFGDLWLHPNDRGFDHYFRKLFGQLKKR